MNETTETTQAAVGQTLKAAVRPGSSKAGGKGIINLNLKRRRSPKPSSPDTTPKSEPGFAAAPAKDSTENEIEQKQRLVADAKQRISKQDQAEEKQKRKEASATARAEAKSKVETSPEAPPELQAGAETTARSPATAKTDAAAEEETSARRPRKGRSEPRRPPGGRGKEARKDPRKPLRVTDALSPEDQEERQRSLAAIRRRNERERRHRQRASGGRVERAKVYRDIQIPDAITVQDLANRMAEPSSAVIKQLMAMGQVATINAVLDGDTAELVAREFSHRPTRVSASDVETGLGTQESSAETLRPRAPVVVVMGHVDHGKTSLLDMIRKTNVVSGEAGAITQHIGAYRVHLADSDSDAPAASRDITFLDTPGHAAFSSMRARGTKVTDIVVLVVAANDGMKPQTEEAVDHARAANVPIVVAINKVDLEGADPDRVRDQLMRKEIMVEKRGGEILDAEISAKTGEGIPALLESILLQAGLLDLKADPDCAAEGAVIEAKLELGRGPVATVLVRRGTLQQGDFFVVGAQWGRARTLRNEDGQALERAGPSIPVEIDGLCGIPEAGDKLVVVESDSRAREIAEYRQKADRERSFTTRVHTDNADFLTRDRTEQEPVVPDKLQVVVKADVRGSAEAIVEALNRIGNESVSVQTLSHGVGAITESDINLAIPSNARIFGFNVRANAKAKEQARRNNIVLSYHSIIYELLEEATRLASGLLAPEIRETILGTAEVAEVFHVSKIGPVAGCRVTDGAARQDAKARLLRDGTVIYTGAIATLKRFKDSVPEVRAGTECGIGLRNQQDIRPGDVIEFFTTEEVERNL